MAQLNFDKDDEFWKQYHKGRPSVPSSFFARLFGYHAEHEGSFETLHEPGAGAGIHTARLAAEFQQVFISDPSAQNIDIARRKLKNVPNCEFHVSKFEDLESIPTESVDMIVGLNMWHWTDEKKAFEAAASQLRSGGTLAVGQFFICAIEDAQAQDIWNRLFQKGSELVIKRRNELADKELRAKRMSLASDTDMMNIPDQHFRPGTVRLKINYPPGYSWAQPFIPPQYADAYGPRVSEVKTSDNVQSEQDDDWKFETDVNGLKEIFASHPFGDDPKPYENLWRELKDLMGEKPFPVAWTVCLIMATKR